jgi:hypothetical protein
MRKHLGWYLDQTDADPGRRQQVLRENDPSRVYALVREALGPRVAIAA